MLLFLLIESWELMILNKILITEASIFMDMFNSTARIKLDRNLFQSLHAISAVVTWRNRIKDTFSTWFCFIFSLVLFIGAISLSYSRILHCLVLSVTIASDLVEAGQCQVTPTVVMDAWKRRRQTAKEKASRDILSTFVCAAARAETEMQFF